MSSFFTLPASQKKRKRSQPSEQTTATQRRPRRKRKGGGDDDSISGSDVSDDNVRQDESYDDEDGDDDEFENEDPSAKRIRLAEQYLANTQKEVLEDAGFDAADVDADNLRRRTGERLKEDTAERKGKLYRWLAHDLAWSQADHVLARTDAKNVTGVAVQGRYVYVVSSDLALGKWEMPDGQQNKRRERRQLRRIAYTRGDRKRRKDHSYQHHTAAILCVAASPDGKYVATGGADNKLIVWNARTLTLLKAFTQHRDSVTSLAFRRGSNQLFSASKDRTVKIWSLDELAYVETLFGHQDEVVDVSALAQEKCVTVGARDRTARLWKVVEESQLVFRGGGAPSRLKHKVPPQQADGGIDLPSTAEDKAYNEGSMDRIACIDDDTFVTGSDNGSLSLWNIHKKKPVFTYPLAHGLDPPLPLEAVSAELEPDEKFLGDPQPRWITALRTIPFSDVIVTGSWCGHVRAWCITQDKRRIEPLGPVGSVKESLEELLRNEGLSSESLSTGALQAMKEGKSKYSHVRGIINDLAVVDQGDRGKDGVVIAAAVGKAHRLGRWKDVEGKVGVALFHVAKKSSDAAMNDGEGAAAVLGSERGHRDDFAGFD